jgi:hypothetical protein
VMERRGSCEACRGSCCDDALCNAMGAMCIADMLLALQGEDCSQPWTGAYLGQYQCVNNCSDVGACRNGFCHCPPGRFGIACHRTEVCRRSAQKTRHEHGLVKQARRQRLGCHPYTHACLHCCLCFLPALLPALRAGGQVSAHNCTGISCALPTQAWASRPHRPDPQRFRIYVYELPLPLALAEQLDFGQMHVNLEFYQAWR